MSEVVLKFPLVATEPPLDQRIAPEVVHLQRLGLCNRRIARALAVDDKTVEKAYHSSPALS
jgi:DNA-binding NarL/FixJ family response regulator